MCRRSQQSAHFELYNSSVMRRKDLAKRLVHASTRTERKLLLAGHPRLADEQLAEEIRKICYAAWSAEPTLAQQASRAMKSLLTVNDRDDVRAIGFWVAGISHITKSNFEAAAAVLDNASSLFHSLDREIDAAQAQVARMLALAFTGIYDEAVKTGIRAMRIFVRVGDDLAAGKVNMNLSNIAARRSRHCESEKYGLSALRLFRASGEKTWEAMAENDLANTYMELNDFRKAERFYRQALATARGERMLVTEAEIEASMGNLALLRGEYAEALKFLELSRRKYETLAMPHQTAIADLEIAGIYAALNLNTEAADIYDRVADAFKQLKLRNEEARARLNLGRCSYGGKNGLVHRSFARSMALYVAEGDDSGQVSVLLANARFEFARGRFDAALAVLADVRSRLKANENFQQSLTAGLLEGETLRMAGEFARADAVLQRVYVKAADSEQVGFARAAVNALGHTAAARGDAELAETRFKIAIRLTEEMRAPIAAEEFSMAFLADKLDAYDGLARLYLAQDRIIDAFVVTERSRSRSLLDSMTSLDPALRPPRALAEELRGLRTELNWFYKRMDERDGDDSSKIRSEIRRRESKLAEVSRQIASVAKKRRSQGFSADVDVASLQGRLSDNRTLIEYVETDGSISAFVVNGGMVDLIADICRLSDVESDLDDLQFQFGACRFGLRNLGRFADELKRRADHYLTRLYERLVAPLEDRLHGDELIFVPCGPLNYVPFPALYDGGKYLVERFTVNHAPGAAVWSALQSRRRRRNKKALLIGYADERIPLVEKEIDTLRTQFDEHQVLKGKNATFAAFADSAPEADLIHLACHGQFRADNPTFSSLHLADGWITVRDICSHRLKANLVTLSACETGLSKIFPGNEILGLVRAFLTAGAISLVVSLWTVNDAAAAALMREMYAFLQLGATPAASLREAQVKFISSGEHPYLWAPFVSIGR